MRTQPANNESKALPVGYRLGEYTVVAALGEGGFGITYRARDTKLNVDVAIKEYFPSVYATRTATSTIVPRPGNDLENYRWGLAEFLKEAQVLAKFKHPHIVRVLRFLEANGTAYTIMEYEQGETLTTYLRRHGGVLGEATLLQLFLPILNGLQAVHDAGLLHLDIKPDNIYMRNNEQPMLIDFGSSRQVRDDTSSRVALTPGFCALEQYPGHGDIGPAADVYGVGATLYRCITGKPPIDALERRQAFARTHADPLPPAASFVRPPYSAHIRACVDQALKLAAADRPASAYALQQGLMGKDMTKLTARPASALLYRPGTGFIGVVAPPPAEPKKKRRRYSGFEKLVAVAVFLATFAVITPKILIDTGHLSDSELYQFIDDTRAQVTAGARAAGDWINEKVFREPPRPKVAFTVPQPRKTAAVPPPAAPAYAPAFGTELEALAPMPIPERTPLALGFLKHGAVLAVATEDGTVQLWDTQTREPRATLPAHVIRAAALGVFPNTQWIAVPDRALGITVFDPLGNPDLVLRDDPPHLATAVTVSANALLLAETGEDGVVNLWELAQRRKRHSFAAAKRPVRALAFSPDEQVLAVGDAAGDIGVWSAADASRLAQWRADASGLAALAFAPDGRRLAAVGAGGALRLWSAASPGEPWAPGPMLADAPAKANAVAFSPDGRWLLATGEAGSVHIWDADDGRLAHRLSTDARTLHALALTRFGRYVAVAGDDNAVRIWK